MQCAERDRLCSAYLKALRKYILADPSGEAETSQEKSDECQRALDALIAHKVQHACGEVGRKTNSLPLRLPPR